MNRGMEYLLIVLVLAAIAAGVLYTCRQQQRSLDWPSTPGQILSARIVESDDGSNNGEGSRRFTVSLEYRYSVAGASLRGTRIRVVTEGHRELAAAQAELQRYPLGASVEVFYDPARPESSVLTRGRE